MGCQSLKIFISRVANLWRPTIQQDSQFLDLPLDVIYAITDQVPLSAQIQLSQTCRVLWYQTRNRCLRALQLLNPEERLETMTGLANFLPDLYPCALCSNLHPIHYRDFLASEEDTCLTYPLSERQCSHPRYPNEFTVLDLPPILFYHVHLATKYTRMDTCHQAYREKLLSKYETRKQNFNMEYGSFALRHIAEPRVIGNRYVLMITYVFSAPSTPNAVERFYNHSPFHPCYSTTLWLGRNSCHHFQRALLPALDRTNDENCLHPQTFSCDQCPTDFLVLVRKDEICISCWCDMGTGLSSQDPCWQSRTSSQSSIGERDPSFEYRHGSVREMYFGSSPQGSPESICTN